uniref:Uncharacterized protein n=1 Tax=Vespula pensylvanica TaxID=30213 RepID=A0A834JKM6_VESPE|nr:hypothetical protein H0235_018254 [Vespula pensylvanica]
MGITITLQLKLVRPKAELGIRERSNTGQAAENGCHEGRYPGRSGCASISVTCSDIRARSFLISRMDASQSRGSWRLPGRQIPGDKGKIFRRSNNLSFGSLGGDFLRDSQHGNVGTQPVTGWARLRVTSYLTTLSCVLSPEWSEAQKIGNVALNVEINRPVTTRSEEAPTRAFMNSKSAELLRSSPEKKRTAASVRLPPKTHHETFKRRRGSTKNPGRLLKLGETTKMLPRQAPQMFQKPKLRTDSSGKNTESV